MWMVREQKCLFIKLEQRGVGDRGVDRVSYYEDVGRYRQMEGMEDLGEGR